MRARKRRSILNTISAAMLEVSIMGLFVILAQPPLRDALFALLSPDSVATSARSATAARAPAANPPLYVPVVAPYADAPAAQGQPTQLAPNQWNVAVASQSPTPPAHYTGWAPIHSAETSYRDIYPPPYGTQSQWR